MEDSELVQDFQRGNEAAFTELVNRHRRAVYRVARGVLRNHEQADEATQDTFVKAHQALPRFKGDSAFKTWVYRIAVNTALDQRSRERTMERTHEAAARADVARSTGPRALEMLIHEEELARLRAAVAGLPERQRTTLLLRVREDLKYSEIADVLQCPIGTVKANFHHAVRNLQRRLGADADDEGRAAADAPRPDAESSNDASDPSSFDENDGSLSTAVKA